MRYWAGEHYLTATTTTTTTTAAATKPSSLFPPRLNRCSNRKNEGKMMYKAAYRMAAHPGQFDLEPLMASRFFSSIVAAKGAGEIQQS